jgi:hypothetical protein
MPRPGLPLVHFNDTRCGSITELRSIILKARLLADDLAERERAAAAAEKWLLAQIVKRRAETVADIEETVVAGPLAPERIAA